LQFAVIPNGTVYGVGSVAREVLDMYRGRGAYYKMFDYPFSKDYKPGNGYDSASTAHEVFAHLWALYVDPETNATLKESMPLSHKFMSEVFSDIKENNDDFASFSKAEFAERQRRFSDRGQGNGRPTNDIAKGKYAPVQVAEVAARGNNEAASGRTGDATAEISAAALKKLLIACIAYNLANLPG
jgi:hypothetical protein